MAKYSKATTPALRGTNLYESQGRAKVAKLKRLKGVGVLALGGAPRGYRIPDADAALISRCQLTGTVVWINDGGPSDELQAAAWAWRQKCIADIAGPPLNGMAQGPLARTDKALAWIGAFAGPSEYGVLRCLGRTFRRTSPVLDGFRRYFPQTLVLVPKPGVKPRARRAAIDTLVRALGSDAEQYLWPVLRGDPNVWTRMLAAK
eukprot:CAMPEP_0119263046 /NCGR_PEP_ID=MMETSP1329-20130426/2583_1 /TAXON_ID=114041 /ORGANISM="Genus nov. species nov., Strain RCC1024" /LENGTH=203 /DNA_ID=CAMNT_0007262743 /DNA_START=62 /DNA_END=669 /DNA_ORIENTATION=+